MGAQMHNQHLPFGLCGEFVDQRRMYLQHYLRESCHEIIQNVELTEDQIQVEAGNHHKYCLFEKQMVVMKQNLSEIASC
jgi:hypothetical protein